MTTTRTFQYRLPTGEVRQAVRHRNLADPRYAIISTRDGTSWGLFRMTQYDHELVRCVKELFASGQSAYITEPKRSEK